MNVAKIALMCTKYLVRKDGTWQGCILDMAHGGANGKMALIDTRCQNIVSFCLGETLWGNYQQLPVAWGAYFSDEYRGVLITSDTFDQPCLCTLDGVVIMWFYPYVHTTSVWWTVTAMSGSLCICVITSTMSRSLFIYVQFKLSSRCFNTPWFVSLMGWP